jgi:hypothetical protein
MVARTNLESFIERDSIIFVYSKTCTPCHLFMDIWNDLIRDLDKNDKTLYLKIEVSCLHKISQLYPTFSHKIIDKMFDENPGVPNIAKYNAITRRTHIFNKERILKNLQDFIKIKHTRKYT